MTENLQEALRQCLAYVGEHYDTEADWDDPKYSGDYRGWFVDQVFLHVFGLRLSERLFDENGQMVADEDLEENEAEAEQAEKRAHLLFGCWTEIFHLASREETPLSMETRIARLAFEFAIDPARRKADESLDHLMDSTPELAELSEAMSLMAQQREPTPDDLTKTPEEFRQGFLDFERFVNGTVEFWLGNIPGGLEDTLDHFLPDDDEGEEDRQAFVEALGRLAGQNPGNLNRGEGKK